jgi:hypothetical protein
MEPYRRGWSWEDSAAQGMAGLALLVGIVIAAVLITILIIVATEIVRIYQRRAFQDTTTARVLWAAAAGQLLFWGLAALLLASPQTTALGAYLAA